MWHLWGHICFASTNGGGHVIDEAAYYHALRPACKYEGGSKAKNERRNDVYPRSFLFTFFHATSWSNTHRGLSNGPWHASSTAWT